MKRYSVRQYLHASQVMMVEEPQGIYCKFHEANAEMLKILDKGREEIAELKAENDRLREALERISASKMVDFAPHFQAFDCMRDLAREALKEVEK